MNMPLVVVVKSIIVKLLIVAGFVAWLSIIVDGTVDSISVIVFTVGTIDIAQAEEMTKIMHLRIEHVFILEI